MTASFLLVGLVLVAMALAETPVRRLPLSSALIYLVVGWAAASLGSPLAGADPEGQAAWLVPVSEWAVLISLFTIGLRLRLPSMLRFLRVAGRLAGRVMVASILLAAVAAHWLLALGWPEALLLAAILAPTDPVLAADVRIRSTEDRDAVRLSLTAEGALNDGTAFPAVMLALGLLDVHPMGPFAHEWLLRDLLWPLAGGVAAGWLCGRALGAAVRRRLAAGNLLVWDELLYLGSIALTYALASAAGVSTFLAVFIAGTALFHEPSTGGASPSPSPAELAALPQRMMAFGERCERLVEVTMVLFIGAALSWVEWRWQLAVFAAALIGIVRPLAVVALIRKDTLPPTQRRLVAWLGIRGVGSLFYLVFVLDHGVEKPLARTLISASLLCIAASILVHGVSATPLMAWYRRQRRGRRRP